MSYSGICFEFYLQKVMRLAWQILNLPVMDGGSKQACLPNEPRKISFGRILFFDNYLLFQHQAPISEDGKGLIIRMRLFIPNSNYLNPFKLYN